MTDQVHNWETVDRLLEQPRALLAFSLLKASPLLLISELFVNRMHECEQFHKDLQARWAYPEKSDTVRTILSDYINTLEKENNKQLVRDGDWGNAGEMQTILPQGIDSTECGLHELIFHAFQQGYLGDDWLDNLNNVLGGDKTRWLFKECPSLLLIAPLTFAGNDVFLPKARPLCHSDVCMLLKVLDTDDFRLAFLGIPDTF